MFEMFKRIFCSGESNDESNDFNVCSKHGHDYRKGVEWERSVEQRTPQVNRYLEHGEISDDVVRFGDGPEYFQILWVYEQPVDVCRDCGHEHKRLTDRTKNSLVRCEDGLRAFSEMYDRSENDEDNDE